MRRLILGVVALFLLSAVITRVLDATGVGPGRLRCACEPDCWCKRPGLTVFRWVTPKRLHRLAAHPLTGADKRALEEAGISN